MDPEYKIDSHQAKVNLLEALHFISCNADFAKISDARRYPLIQPNQHEAIGKEHSRLKNLPNDTWYSNVPQIEIPIIDKKDKDLRDCKPTILVGGEIESKKGEIIHSSFSLCITFNASNAKLNKDVSLNTGSCCLASFRNTKRIVRRFHFDHQPNEVQKPSEHLQYGGHFPEGNGNHKDLHYCHESVDSPRLHCLPMDFILLFDLAIRNFTTPLGRLIGEQSWRTLVVNSQNIWWSSYVSWLNSMVSAPSPRVLHEVLYG